MFIDPPCGTMCRQCGFHTLSFFRPKTYNEMTFSDLAFFEIQRAETAACSQFLNVFPFAPRMFVRNPQNTPQILHVIRNGMKSLYLDICFLRLNGCKRYPKEFATFQGSRNLRIAARTDGMARASSPTRLELSDAEEIRWSHHGLQGVVGGPLKAIAGGCFMICFVNYVFLLGVFVDSILLLLMVVGPCSCFESSPAGFKPKCV